VGTENKIVCGIVDSFSTFAILYSTGSGASNAAGGTAQMGSIVDALDSTCRVNASHYWHHRFQKVGQEVQEVINIQS
jgi:hypothetical protein